MINYGYCNICLKLIPMHREEREGKVYLVKECEDCGRNETLISGYAERYNLKRTLNGSLKQDDCATAVCKINCTSCQSHKNPNMVFVDVTNRCNMNCPICANNTPAMGFKFEPPLDFYRKIIDHCAQMTPRPSIQLFGGEPTVREELFDIIDMARKARLRVRINTNGIRLADNDYCKKLVKSGATILMAFDGKNPRLYSELRNNPDALEKKLKAIDNLSKLRKGKVVLMTLIAKGYNDRELSDLFDFCYAHSNRIRGIYFIPLAHTWSHDDLDVVPDRVTTEDVEVMVEKAVQGGNIEFIPAGILGKFPVLLGLLSDKPIPFGGAHPNCESMTLLVHDGEQFVSISGYLKTSLYELVERIMHSEAALKERLARFERGVTSRFLGVLRLKKITEKLMAYSAVAALAIKYMDYKKIVGETNIFKVLWKGLKILGDIIAGKKTSRIMQKHTKMKYILQILIVPFEDKMNAEGERLHDCAGHFAYVDPATDKVKTMPVCSWPFFKHDLMKKIMDRYNP